MGPERRAVQRVAGTAVLAVRERTALADLARALSCAHDDLPAEVRSAYWRAVDVLNERGCGT